MIIKLRVIPKPPKGTCTLIEAKVIPAFKGAGDEDYICGNCEAILAEKLAPGQVSGGVVHCPKCGKYNEFPLGEVSMEIMKFTEDNIAKYNLLSLPPVENIEPIYSIVTRTKTHNIKGGDNVEIDIYLTGLGIPDANKLVVLWSSPNVVDASSPAHFLYATKVFTKKISGKDMIFPLAGKDYVERVAQLDATGNTVQLNKGYFLPVPGSEELDMPGIMGERNIGINNEIYPPLSLSLKTLEKAKPGDYAISIAFTYRHRNIIRQASDNVEFRVTSWWDRNQWWIFTFGSIVAFVLLIIAVINSI